MPLPTHCLIASDSDWQACFLPAWQWPCQGETWTMNDFAVLVRHSNHKLAAPHALMPWWSNKITWTWVPQVLLLGLSCRSLDCDSALPSAAGLRRPLAGEPASSCLWCPVPSRHCTFTFMLIAAGWWSKSLSVSQWLFITSDSDDCHSLSLLEWPWRLSQRYMWLQRTCQFPVCRTWTFAARVFLVCAASCSYAVWALSSWFNLGFSSWAFAWAFVVLSWSIETSFPE